MPTEQSGDRFILHSVQCRAEFGCRSSIRVYESRRQTYSANLNLSPLHGEYKGIPAQQIITNKKWDDLVERAVRKRTAEQEARRLRGEATMADAVGDALTVASATVTREREAFVAGLTSACHVAVWVGERRSQADPGASLDHSDRKNIHKQHKPNTSNKSKQKTKGRQNVQCKFIKNVECFTTVVFSTRTWQWWILKVPVRGKNI